MSRIARQLCNEIEAPISEKEHCRNAEKCNDKPRRSLLVEKQRVVSKVVPSDRSVSRIKFKSEETVHITSFIDKAVNTTLRGSPLSDSNCVTLVRNRANVKCSCKTPHKCRSFRRISKEVQTFDPKLYSFSDKACFHCIETASCGTQFLNLANTQEQYVTTIQGVSQKDENRLNTPQRHYLTQTSMMQKDSMGQANINLTILRQLELRAMALTRQDSRHEPEKSSNKAPSTNFMGARRWSLTQYPTRGPDF